MYADLLPHLRCPACALPLTLHGGTYDHTHEIIGGALACAGCAQHYPLQAGIADFLGPPQPTSLAQQTNEWPSTAWVYERAWRPFALTLLSRSRFPYRRELPLLAELMQPQRGGLYLDIGCSNGLYARALTRALRGTAGHVVGVDAALPMLHEARHRARAAGLRISFVRARAQALPIYGGVAAGVAIGGSLNEIGDLNGCLAEVRRTLAADGRFVAMTLSRAASAPGRALQHLLASGGVAFWSPAELTAHLAAQGLRTLASQHYGLVMFHLAVPISA